MYNQACNFLFIGFYEALKRPGTGRIEYDETIRNLLAIAVFFS
jgi:hypothetical protein